jgi:hypothetical protein
MAGCKISAMLMSSSLFCNSIQARKIGNYFFAPCIGIVLIPTYMNDLIRINQINFLFMRFAYIFYVFIESSPVNTLGSFDVCIFSVFSEVIALFQFQNLEVNQVFRASLCSFNFFHDIWIKGTSAILSPPVKHFCHWPFQRIANFFLFRRFAYPILSSGWPIEVNNSSSRAPTAIACNNSFKRAHQVSFRAVGYRFLNFW